MLAEAPPIEAGAIVSPLDTSATTPSLADGASSDAREEVVLDLVRPLIGLDRSSRYALRPLGPRYEPYASLVSLDEQDLRLVVVPPGLIFTDYVIEIPEADCRMLELEHMADVAVLTIVRRKGLPAPVVNLMGPLVVNRRTKRAAQVVLAESGYGVMVPVDSGTARPK